VLTSIVTIDMVWSLCLLVAALPLHKELPQDLLRSATALWITNILVFASWYWRLDAGGPRARELRGQVIEVDASKAIVASYGMINSPGYSPRAATEMNAPYSAYVIGDYTGITPPF
jgi:hypothetical protein